MIGLLEGVSTKVRDEVWSWNNSKLFLGRLKRKLSDESSRISSMPFIRRTQAEPWN